MPCKSIPARQTAKANVIYWDFMLQSHTKFYVSVKIKEMMHVFFKFIFVLFFPKKKQSGLHNVFSPTKLT